MIGQTISHYKILEKLGGGGMGIVYKAQDTKLDRIVALKFLPSELTQDPEAKERFIHEAKAASALNHPNICAIHTIEEYEDPACADASAGRPACDPEEGSSAGRQHFIDMEYVEGKTLKELLVIGQPARVPRSGTQAGHLSFGNCLDIAIQIGEGLNAAHKKGIVHRDIKPDNIMLTDEGQVKIMDFGLAKFKGRSRLTKTHSTLGTLSYMSPEQARGEEVDQRSDIFSFGAVLYEMITGRRPFKGEHEAAIMYSLMNETPEPLARYKSDVPAELQRVIDKALSKDKSERYQHVDEMVSDLKRAQHGLSGSVISTTKKSKVLWLVAAVVLVLALLGVYFFYPKYAPISANSKTIAVLPFTNLSADKEDEYFSEGVMEDILTQLSKISELNVISRTTMMHYKGTKKPLKEIGRELNAGIILEGSVRRSGDRIRISSQLIDAETDRHLWADNYDRELKDIFTIQSDVAKQIASALEAKISPSVISRIEKKQTENTEAYQLYLKGRFYWNKRTIPDLEKSIDYFNQAIQKDPSYALAYAGLANSYVILPAFGSSSKEYYPKAQHAATRALEFDSTLAEAYAVIANINENQYDWTNAESKYKRAIELNPNYPTAHQWYSYLLLRIGRYDEAIAAALRAAELDPLSLIINYNLSYTFFSLRQYNKAKEQSDKGIDLDPNFPWSYYVRGLVSEAQGKYEKAMKDFNKLNMLTQDDPTTLGEIGRLYGRTGRKEEALKVLRELKAYYKQGYAVCSSIAIVYHGLGDKEKTFEWLEKSINDQEGLLLDMIENPLWDDIKSDPRFIALVKKMGLGK